ncbi:MAG: hypothetical protein ACOYOB_20450 [Myxococcota bacterium]
MKRIVMISAALATQFGCSNEAEQQAQIRAAAEKAAAEATAREIEKAEQKALIQDQVKAGIEKAEAEKAAAAAAALAKEKAELEKSPAVFIQAADMESFDKGLVNDYRELVGVRLTNRSRFGVTNISGRVDWLTDASELVGSSPVEFKGTLAAGANVVFTKDAGTLSSGTIQDAGTKARLEITKVTVVE